MQKISNLLLNLILLYPLLIIAFSLIENNRKNQLRTLLSFAVYLFIVNKIMIEPGALVEIYLFPYFLLLAPFFLLVMRRLIDERNVSMSKVDIKGRDKYFMVLVFGFILICGLYIKVNTMNDIQVLNLNHEIIESIRNAEDKETEIIKIADKPRTLLNGYKDLLKIDSENYHISYSGNAVKKIKGTYEEANVAYTYTLVYRRHYETWEFELIDGVGMRY